MKFRGNYDFLSNMYFSKIEVNGLKFTNAEACFQSFKTTDVELRKKFQGITGPQAKKLGRSVELRPDWDSIKVEVMRAVVEAKFRQNPELLKRLVNTKADLVEENTWNDTFWGVCKGKGRNELGKILMDLRKHATKR